MLLDPQTSKELWCSSCDWFNHQIFCKLKISITLWGPQTLESVSRTDINRNLASVLELYRNNPSVSFQSRSGCTHRLQPITPMWLMICSVLSMQSCSYESFVIFWPVVKASFWPLLEPYAFRDLMLPLENSALQAEKQALDFDLVSCKSWPEQI